MPIAWLYCWFIVIRLVSFLIELSTLSINQQFERGGSGTMHGLGRQRSKYGKFCEKRNITQLKIVKHSGLNRETVAKAFIEGKPKFRLITQEALIEVLNELTGESKEVTDFW